MVKMALRLRKDVQKASYYVWFLGAQEAKGLRGPRVLLPVIPRLIERANEQEPLKVTLQVSHKGLKIFQGANKHFIPHSAITCSVQTDDIVGCILLLYNPATKCPLHVHAYRCDSETTAQALHQQLQILINRPENQKRFSELETRLGLASSQTTQQAVTKTEPKPIVRRTENSTRRFDSSLGSDTGTSTRESECSEEHVPTSPKANLYDSLAAELRAKLKGGGPPLLLPPRDYDTVHRSKGNLAAIELRRCRNSGIVGVKQGISSRGSSGIGSDLAPSPERQDGQSSSDDDWINDHRETLMQHQKSQRKTKLETKPYKEKIAPIAPVKPRPHVPVQREIRREENFKTEIVPNSRYKFSTREEHKSSSSIHSKDDEEEIVKPVLTKMRPFREVFDDQKFHAEEKRFIVEDKNKFKKIDDGNDRRFYEDERTLGRRQSSDKGKFLEVETAKPNYRENLTDKQKYRESLVDKNLVNNNRYREPSLDKVYRDEPITYRRESVEKPVRRDHSEEYNKNVYNREKSLERSKFQDRTFERERTSYTDRNSSSEFDRNPYKEAESKPYRESIEKMLKSPVIRYRSYDESADNTWSRNREDVRNSSTELNQFPTQRYREDPVPRYKDEIPSRYKDEQPSNRYKEETSPIRYKEETPQIRYQPRQKISEKYYPKPPESINVSPKERFEDAKEKFKAMERERLKVEAQNNLHRRSSIEPRPRPRHGSIDRTNSQYSEKNHREDGWSSEEEIPAKSLSRYRELPNKDRYPGLDRDREPIQQMRDSRDSRDSRITPAKSLGNLVKGYRHSYAEPQHPMPRNSGRVGLAAVAVNPY